MIFSSSDGRFGLDIQDKQLTSIIDDCKTSESNETGGILVGTYTDTHDCAKISVVTTAPKDSQKGRMSFFRGVHGLTDILGDLWNEKREYYLGEWHFHPYANPEPSGTDISQMHEIASDASYKCPEPVMLIIGGDPDGDFSIRAFVFPDGKMVEMNES